MIFTECIGYFSIGLLIVGTIGNPIRKCTAKAPLGRIVCYMMFFSFIYSNGVYRMVPRGIVVIAVGTDIAGYPIMEYFADPGGEVAIVLE